MKDIKAEKLRRKMLGLFVGFEKVGPYMDVMASPGRNRTVKQMERIAGLKVGSSFRGPGQTIMDKSDRDFDCWSRLRASVPRSLRDRMYKFEGPKAIAYGLDTGGEWFRLVGVIEKKDGKTPPCQRQRAK